MNYLPLPLAKKNSSTHTKMAFKLFLMDGKYNFYFRYTLFFWDYLLKSADNLGVKIICENPKEHCLFNQNLNKTIIVCSKMLKV